MPISETLNLDFLDEQYRSWEKDPATVSSQWRLFFEGFTLAPKAPSGEWLTDNARRQSRVDQLIARYRELGHLLACLDPLSPCPTSHPLLDIKAFSLSNDDLEASFHAPGLGPEEKPPLKTIIAHLKETYCQGIGVEYQHLQDPDEKRWLQQRMEPNRNRPQLTPANRRRILEKLGAAANFEQFLNKKYVGVTRFSLEGGDALIPMLDELMDQLAQAGAREVILGMAHRGRLNVLTNILQKSFEDIFAEFESCYDPDHLVGDGDVKYHSGYLANTITAGGKALRIFLADNPSHLEAIDPVVEGIARARQDQDNGDAEKKVVPVLLHGDAAFAGQGIVPEVLNMSQLKGYKTGGTVHVVINNQIGYTTLPKDARSTRYSTDVAKMLMVPIFHVHGENPESVVQVARLSAQYRDHFHKDVVIDLVCYRRWGHNEGDEPYFTQPLMYKRIKGRPTPFELYSRQLITENVISEKEIESLQTGYWKKMEADYDEIRGSICLFPQNDFFDFWDNYGGNYGEATAKTGVAKNKLIHLAKKLNYVPDGFTLNRKLVRLHQDRLKCVTSGEKINWGNAEALAFASLVTEGYPVRLSGQDVGRGTFSQRHSVWMDSETGEPYIPLNHLSKDQAPYMVFNSHLAEASVLGFEYGYAMVRPETLVMWEAQFGDFVNSAQTIIDLFIASGQSKWQRLNGVVMLLPHGLEGMGPEHSSARFERFLQLCAEDNIQVANPTTPAQYFHLLRRQMIRSVRKPLIVMAPKSLLRHPLAVSTTQEFSRGQFNTVMNDATVPKTPKVIFCCGKLFYELFKQRESVKGPKPAIIRLEQIYPFPENEVAAIVKAHKNAKKWFWVQEEPENMGAWQFVRYRLERIVGKPLTYIGRPAGASPATGFSAVYKQVQTQIVIDAMEK